MNKTPPKLTGHSQTGTGVLVADREDPQHVWTWGPTTVRLYGTPDEPQLFAQTPGRGQTSVPANRDDLMRFAREVLVFLGEGYGVPLPPWRATTDWPENQTSGRPWFLTRYDDDDPAAAGIPAEDRYRYSTAGVLVRYATEDDARRVADRLNRQEGGE